MTREAKIGMLTGLGVIVLIGVLLSDYLGDAKGAGTNATGRMAALPIGANYRQQIVDPVTVPAITRSEGLTGGNELSSPISTSMGITLPPMAYATDQTATQGPVTTLGPVIAPAVSPEAIGPSTVQLASGGPPTISLETSTVATRSPDVAKPQQAAPGTTYVIVAGDNLGKISRKFYNSSKPSDLQRIVAANPGILKDASTPLVVNKKLIIPSAPVAVIPAAPAAKIPATVVAKKADPVMIYLPGPLNGQAEPAAAQVVAPPKKETGKTYEIQSGDTLEKIARKYSPSNTKAYVEKLKTLNGIKDPTALAIGTKLKLPA